MAADKVTCPACGLEVAAGTAVCPIDGTELEPTAQRKALPDLLTDTQVGEYVVKGVVGSGGMGVVYEGLQPVIGKRVAIKVLRREVARLPEEAARLLSEARLVNAIGHRGIIDIFSFGALADGRQYFVMEFLDGVSLYEHIRGHAPLEVAEALQILDEILAALSAAHGAGVIHRDLKPSNVFLVSQADGSRYVKLLDFGIAKQSTLKHGDSPQTRVSRILGTPEFMAPEQARGSPVGPRTDLYAIGCIAFELLTGRLPFDGVSGWEVVNHHVNTPPPSPSAFNETIPDEVDAIVLWLLAKDPAARPPSAEAVRQELKAIRRIIQMSNTLLAKTPGPAEPPHRAVTAPSGSPVVALPPTIAYRDLSKRPTAAEASSHDTIPTLGRGVEDLGLEKTKVSSPSLETMTPTGELPVPAVPIPARTLESAERTDELIAPRRRFSRLALAAIGALAGGLAFLVFQGSIAPPPPDPAPARVEAPVNPPLVEPPRAPPPAAPVTEPEAPAPTPAAPAPGKRAPSLSASRAALLARIENHRKEVSRPGAQQKPIALMLLGDAKTQALAIKTPKDLREAEKYLLEWERKFGPDK